MAFSPGRRTVATVTAQSGTLTVADAKRPERATTLTTLPDRVLGTNAMAFSPDGRTLAVIAGPTLMLWNVADRTRPTLLARLSSAGFGAAVTFSPDGRTLATAGGDPTITLWNVADRAAPGRLATLVGHSSSVESLAFSPDGHTLASGSYDHTAVLWDVTDRARPHRLTTLTSHRMSVSSVVFSPDGRTLATAGRDYAVILWDATNPAGPIQLATMRTTSGAGAGAVAFRPDGRTLAVVEERLPEPATVTLWNYRDLNTLRADPARYACAVTGRGLTAEEWARFVPELRYRPTCPD